MASLKSMFMYNIVGKMAPLLVVQRCWGYDLGLAVDYANVILSFAHYWLTCHQDPG